MQIAACARSARVAGGNRERRSILNHAVAPATVPSRWRSHARVLVAAALVAPALRFLVLGALPFVIDISPEQFGHFWSRRLVLLAHLAGGTVALLVGPFQLWSGLAAFRMDRHRWTGRAYVVAVLVGGFAAFYLSAYTQGLAKAMSLQALGIVWWTTTWMAYRAVRGGRETQHKRWAARSYAVTFSFVTFRLGVDAGVLTQLGSEPVAAWLWLSWAIPLFVTELALRFRTSAVRELLRG
jgi:Predicted membrane protein (DUF2306)